MNHTTLIALNFELPTGTAANPLPEWLPLVPAGRFAGRDKRSWLNDDPDSVIAYNRSLDRDIVFDQEHATEIKAPQGDPAPAVGWIGALENRNGVVWGKVDWNDDGQALLASRKYRYYSPALKHDAQGRVIGISSVALTNKHNLGLPALNQQSTSENTMTLSAAIRTALKLKEDATEGDAIVAINALHQTALNAEQKGPDLEKYAPRADLNLALAENQTLKAALNSQNDKSLEDEIIALVDGAVKDRKIAPASRDEYIALCRETKSTEKLKSILAKTPAILGDTTLDNQKVDQGNKVALNSEQEKINTMFGNSAEELAKHGK